MPSPYSNVWLSDKAEERVVLTCLEKFARTGSTGFHKKKIKEFAKIGNNYLQYEKIECALVEASVLNPLDASSDVYIFNPEKAMEYFSAKGKDPESIIRENFTRGKDPESILTEKYPAIDLKKALKRYSQARKGKL